MHKESLFKVENSVLQKIEDKNLLKRNIQLFVKRDDLIHPIVSGNKWRKLKYNILNAQALKAKGILTFGGAYSNHLVATAFACKELKLASIGIVRGEELNSNSNETLKKCASLGMKLVFVSRLEYNLKNDWEYHKELQVMYPDYFVVPEGGANFYGMIACQEIWKEIPFVPNHLFVAQGTSTTSCGLLLAKPKETNLHVVPVLKGYDSLQEMKKLVKLVINDSEIEDELLDTVLIHNEFHFEGYGKYTDELVKFIQDQIKVNQLPLDHIYTAKCFYALWKIIENKEYDNSTIVFLHTGGLQGSTFWMC